MLRSGLVDGFPVHHAFRCAGPGIGAYVFSAVSVDGGAVTGEKEIGVASKLLRQDSENALLRFKYVLNAVFPEG